METATIPGIDLNVSRIGLGTWAIGGWLWGGADDRESIRTIHAALDKGINLLDSAPVYGFGHSEEIVGQAIAQLGCRDKVIIATKVGLQWSKGLVLRNASRARILKEVDDSLRRLQTSYIDIYQVHWPDPRIPVEETAEAMNQLYREGKIRAIGVTTIRRPIWSGSVRLRPCISTSLRITFLNVEAKVMFFLTSAKITSLHSLTAACVAACSVEG